MQPADLFRAVEIGERARDAEHAVIAERRELRRFGGVAQQLLSLRIRLRDSRHVSRRSSRTAPSCGAYVRAMAQLSGGKQRQH
jgi:hypothetical protein